MIVGTADRPSSRGNHFSEETMTLIGAETAGYDFDAGFAETCCPLVEHLRVPEPE
jgi:hypothetical protein